jgi:hypothetical protein
MFRDSRDAGTQQVDESIQGLRLNTYKNPSANHVKLECSWCRKNGITPDSVNNDVEECIEWTIAITSLEEPMVVNVTPLN